MALTSMHCCCQHGWHKPGTQRSLISWQAQHTHPLSARMCHCPPDCTCDAKQGHSGNAPPIRHVLLPPALHHRWQHGMPLRAEDFSQ